MTDESEIMRILLLYSLCNLLEMANYSFNFYVYCVYNRHTEPVFIGLLRCLGIDSQPGGIDSWAP
jgi:hypothetical protein